MKPKCYSSILEIPKPAWQAIETPDFPFADYDFLCALEQSGSVAGNTGWIPRYLTLWQQDELVAACYSYEKNHSYGEYIFDWAWAEAAQNAGLGYYPKLLAAVPFTPATGPKFLCHPKVDHQKATELLIQELLRITAESGAHSTHLLFITADEAPLLARMGFHIRHSYQFHWHNQSYKSFEQFLESLKQKRRKEIRRERQSICEQGISVHAITGSALTVAHADEAYQLYLATIEKKWSQDYLTAEFFNQIFQTMAERIIYFRALAPDQTPLGASLCFYKGQHLYGRYWGSFIETKNLHFELCYYQLIEWAIAHGIQRVEAGAQGPQKLPRGFLPKLTYSAHNLRHQGLDRAVGDFIAEEKQALETA